MQEHDLNDATTLPWSPESESGVLGAVLIYPDTIDRVEDVLQPKHFFDKRYGRIYGAVCELTNSNKAVDIFTVLDHLQVRGQAQDIDLAMLNDLTQCAGSSGAARRYAEIVVERFLIRGLMSAADEVKSIAVEAGMPVLERIDRAQDLFQQLQQQRAVNDATAIEAVATELLDHINDLAEGRITPGVPTRFPGFDRLFGGGLKPGKLVVIAARPSIGKTALALAIAEAFASQGHPAGVWSLEMERQELAQRLLAMLGEIDLGHLSTGKLDNFEWAQLTNAVERLRLMPLYINDKPAASLADIQSGARKLKRERGLSLVVVDYLQLMAASAAKAKDSRHHQIEEISRGLKTLAKQLGVPVVLLSQLSREVEKRTSGKPTLGDLKESGAIEEDADIVILLSLDHVREDGTVVVHAEVAKNRGGKKGFVKLAFEGRYQRFRETIETDALRRAAAPVKQYAEDF